MIKPLLTEKREFVSARPGEDDERAIRPRLLPSELFRLHNICFRIPGSVYTLVLTNPE